MPCYTAQVAVAVAAVIVVALVTISIDAQGITLERAVVVDGPTLFPRARSC